MWRKENLYFEDSKTTTIKVKYGWAVFCFLNLIIEENEMQTHGDTKDP